MPDFGKLAELITALAALGALVSSVHASHRVQAVHLQINSRMDQLIVALRQVERSAGILEGRRQQIAQDAAADATKRGDGPC